MLDHAPIPAPIAPAHAARSRRAALRRRGTVLLMVVGVLALLAIIAVVYATLGRADRSSSATLVQQQRSDLQVAAVADYFASVIAQSSFARYPEPTAEGSQVGRPVIGANPIVFNRAHTYPWTDAFFISAPIDSAAIARSGIPVPAGTNIEQFSSFTPTGDVVRPWVTPAASLSLLDPREFGDPFLAAFRPTALGTDPNSANTLDFLPSRLRDWAHISNFAPSGNFINLANLRPEHGGFNARHGFNGPGLLSYGLTLFNPATGVSYQVGTPQPLPQRPSRIDDTVTPPPVQNASPLVPAHWTTDQLSAFRPPVDFDHDPTDFEYLPNQWADTDGDGFVDARWFTLDRIEDFESGGEAIVRSVVPTGTRLRYVFAARAVDNSAMLNVNVHTDFLNGPLTLSGVGTSSSIASLPTSRPDDITPPGLTPADVDLARLLTMRDAFTDARDGWNLPETGAAGFTRGGALGDNLRDYTFNVGGGPGARTASDLIGRSAFAALENMRRTGASRLATFANDSVFPIFERHEIDAAAEYTDGAFRRDRFQFETLASAIGNDALLTRRESTGAAANRLSRLSGLFGIDDELELRAFWGLNNPDTRSALESAIGGRSDDNLFRTYSPLRDTRSLGIEAFGRDQSQATLFPISSDPSADAKRTLLGAYADVRQFLTTVSGARPIKDPGVAPTYTVQMTSALPPISTTAADFNNRQLRAEAASTGTPIVGELVSRPDVTALLNSVQRFAEENAQTPKTTAELREFVEFAANSSGLFGTNADAGRGVVYQIFELYANAIMPYTHRTFYPGAWQFLTPTTSVDTKHYINGLAYGGSPELALRLAAHMAVNLVDAFDRDRQLPSGGTPAYDRHIPTAVTLILAENPNEPSVPAQTNGNSIPARGSRTEDIERAFPHPQLKLHPTQRLPETRGQNGQGIRMAQSDPNVAGRLTMYGVEPQPFLVEVAAFAMYTDAPRSAGGDIEEAPSSSTPGPINRLQPGGGSEPAPVTIRIEPDLTEGDFLGEILAFKLNNPFDVTVTLYDPDAPATQDQVIYYLEYANRFYAFCPTEFTNTSGAGLRFRRPGTSSGRIDLAPGETLTFYAINPGTLDQLWDRFRNVLERAPQPVRIANIGTRDTTLKSWLEQQFGDGSRVNGRTDIFDRQLTPIYPDSLQPIVPSNRPNFRIFGQQDEVDIFGENVLPGANAAGSPSGNGTPQALQAATPVERKVAHLWRVMRTEISSDPRGNALEGDLNVSTEFNDPSNDLLADRLRDPTIAGDGKLFTFVRPTNTLGVDPNQKIGGAEGGDEASNTLPSLRDNTGFSTIIWASLRRPADKPRASGGTLEPGNFSTRGVLPPWCMEVRSDHGLVTGNAAVSFSLNDISGDSGVNDAGRKSNYTTGENRRFISMRDLVTATAPAAPTIRRAMTQVSGFREVPNLNRDRVAADDTTFRQVAVEYHAVGELSTGESINPSLFSRSADFLLPLAIGPVFDPSVDFEQSNLSGWDWSGNAGDPKMSKRELQWLTRAEAIALSAGYFSPARQDDVLRDFALEEQLGTGSYQGNYPSRAKTDRGHLRLDAFTPYLDFDGPDDEPARPIGSGVPFALAVIDQFRSASGVATPSVNVNGTSWPRGQNYVAAPGGGTFNPRLGAPVTLVPGLMNINTLSTIPMRQLPLLAPDTSDDSWLRRSISSRPSVFSEVIKPPPSSGGPAPAVLNWDVVSTIEAYRDRRDVFDLRFDDSPGAQPLTSAAQSPLRFRRFTRDQIARVDFNANETAPLNAGRGILRNARGIKSLGELFAINVRDNPETTGSGADPFWTGSMFAIAPERTPFSGTLPTTFSESRTTAWPEISGSMFLDRNSSGQATTPPTRRAMQIDESYADKLAIGNALLNTVSVRSDIFTVYFLIHGYSPEDIEAVDGRPQEPLIPSFAKRFAMVLDRSNVFSPGDKPRVLLLREVPVR